MLLASAVVVWEWLNEHGRWRPYSPAVSHHIEAVIRANPRGGSVVLGQVDSKLSPYIIDIQSLHQFRQDTGTLRPVRRSFYDPSSAPGRGIVWEWENDNGSWTPYDMEICITIQHAYEKQHPWIDLTSIGFCYIIDFGSMSQVNRQTQRTRRIHRRLDITYPLVAGGLQKSQSWPAAAAATATPAPPCTCQQCLLVMSVKANAAASATTPQGRKLSGTKSVAPAQQQQQTGARSPPKNLGGGGGQMLNPSGRPQATSTPALIQTTAGSGTSPRGAKASSAPSVGAGRASQNTLSRPTLQRIAIAQSRALIASGVSLSVPLSPLSLPVPLSPLFHPVHVGILSNAGSYSYSWTPQKLALPPPPKTLVSIPNSPLLEKFSVSLKHANPQKGKTPEEVVKKYLQKVRNPPEEVRKYCVLPFCFLFALPPFLFIYFFLYLFMNEDGSLQCPTCKTIYGVKTGTQPPGKMEYHIIPHSLPGHPDCKTIRLIYNIPPGIQGPEHPNPGKSFTARGFPRHCYLPDNEKGRKVLKLLLVAWDRRLIFTIGTSSTTGESDTVIWNEVHHKTEFGSNLTGHGFPDPNYLDNVLVELAAQGITEECLREKD
uniref:E3 ubiquitin-protein ligase n=1 Tax=Latimeria chalumnae TaxID=7897 RepID=H2ZZD2_LATCH